MSTGKRWLLPDGVVELLPPQARQLEELRRKLLDIFDRWGYELVIPPIVEYLDSLLSGIGEDLDLQTFKLTDQVSGRMMGVRADITPQVARIDAHRIPVDTPQRLCYVGPVVHTLPDKFAGSRNPLQIGAELYGHDGIESDVEIIALLMELLNAAGISGVTLELGHMNLFHTICQDAGFDAGLESRLLDLLLMKDIAGLLEELEAAAAPQAVKDHLCVLITLNGDTELMPQISQALSNAPAAVTAALDDVSRLIELLCVRVPGINIHLDFAEIRGYRYHTGIMFAVYTPSAGRAIAWGGRYDNIGQTFGRSRSATGFSTDLKTLVELGATKPLALNKIFAPPGTTDDLLSAIKQLRAAGYVVVQGLPGQRGGPAEMKCEQRMTNQSGSWQLEDV